MLWRRGEDNRTILAIARGKILPEALCQGRAELLKHFNGDGNEGKKRQLAGKRKTMQLIKSIHNHDKDMRQVRDAHSLDEYISKRRRIEKSLTTSAVQFKKERIKKKVDRVKATYSKVNAPNRFQRREGYTLTPVMQGKVQYGKMKKGTMWMQ